MVTQNVMQRAIGAHGDSLRTGIIIFDNRRAGHFLVRAHKIGSRRAIENALDAPAIAIINEGGIVERRGWRHGRSDRGSWRAG